jgi:hypothetical protein
MLSNFLSRHVSRSWLRRPVSPVRRWQATDADSTWCSARTPETPRTRRRSRQTAGASGSTFTPGSLTPDSIPFQVIPRRHTPPTKKVREPPMASTVRDPIAELQRPLAVAGPMHRVSRTTRWAGISTTWRASTLALRARARRVGSRLDHARTRVRFRSDWRSTARSRASSGSP